jgi:hypothetical protein
MLKYSSIKVMTTAGETSERKSNVGGEDGIVGGGGITTKRKLTSTQKVGEVFEPFSNTLTTTLVAVRGRRRRRRRLGK